jgi:hypothetical protein
MPSTTYLGTLGDRSGVNVAKVEVVWFYDDPGLGPDSESSSSHTGHYIVHATGNEPECQGEYGTIYNVFEELVHEAMEARRVKLGFADWDTEDTSSY